MTIGSLSFVVFAAASYAQKDQRKVVGTWDSDLPNNPRFTFNKDGSGSITYTRRGTIFTKRLKWYVKDTKLVFSQDGVDSNAIIKSADENKINLHKPDATGKKDLVLTRVRGNSNSYHDKLIGTWDSDMPFNPRLTFAKDGAGAMSVSVQGKTATKDFKWRLNDNNLIFTLDGKDMGALITSAEKNKINLHDPAAPGKKDFSFTRVK